MSINRLVIIGSQYFMKIQAEKWFPSRSNDKILPSSPRLIKGQRFPRSASYAGLLTAQCLSCALIDLRSSCELNRGSSMSLLNVPTYIRKSVWILLFWRATQFSGQDNLWKEGRLWTFLNCNFKNPAYTSLIMRFYRKSGYGLAGSSYDSPLSFNED